jgi:hypothetical protein
VIESLSFVFKAETRFVHKNRHSSQTVLNSIHSLTEIRLQFEKLSNQYSVLKSSESNNETKPKPPSKSQPQKIINFPPSPKDHKGLFNFLWQECNGKNPHLSGMIKVSASHICDERYREWNILEWGTSNSWFSGPPKGEQIWIDFDLLGRSFILNGMSICVSKYNFPKCWSLLGSDGSENFKIIYESNNESQFDCPSETDVFLPIQNSKSFKRFRLLAKSKSWYNADCFEFYFLEFYGELN